MKSSWRSDGERTELRRGDGVALWRQIGQAIEGEIARGRYAPGDRLPTEQMLAERFAVNRHTVRRALGELAERAVVRVEQGRGMFVQQPVIDYRISRQTRFTENLTRQKRTASQTLLASGVGPADAAAARALAIAPGASVVWLETIGEADGRAISVALVPAAALRRH